MKKQTLLLIVLMLMGVLSSSCEKKDSNVPEACFVASEERKTGIPINFSTSCTLNASSYHWDFGDGQTSTDGYPSHTYNKGGDYPVTLTVDNSVGDTDEVTNVMIVEAPV
jgi:PKD repeat protein